MKPEKQKKHAALRALLIALLTLALLAAGFAAYRFRRLPRAGFAVHFVDIGQGDAAIVVCDGKTLVIDGGMPESGAKLVDYLQNTLHVSTIDAMIGTHPHADHIGGLPDVIRAFAVKTLYSPVDEFEGKPFEAMKRAADAKNVRITVPQAGQRFSLGRAEVEFYAPLGIYDDVNDLSLVTRITYGQTAFLFTGEEDFVITPVEDGFPVYGRRGKAVRKRHDRQRRGAVRNGAQGRPSRQQHVELLSLSAAGHAVLRGH